MDGQLDTRPVTDRRILAERRAIEERHAGEDIEVRMEQDRAMRLAAEERKHAGYFDAKKRPWRERVKTNTK